MPPVYQCKNGHLYCDGCLSQLESQPHEKKLCSVCRISLPSKEHRVRSLIGDAFAATLCYHCPFRERGCSLELKLTDHDAHRKVCKFNPLRCACPATSGCNWEGLSSDLQAHVASIHAQEVDYSVATRDKFLSAFKETLICDYRVSLDLDLTGDGKKAPRPRVVELRDRLLLVCVKTALDMLTFEVSTLGYLAQAPSQKPVGYTLSINEWKLRHREFPCKQTLPTQLSVKGIVPAEHQAPHGVPIPLQFARQLRCMDGRNGNTESWQLCLSYEFSER